MFAASGHFLSDSNKTEYKKMINRKMKDYSPLEVCTE